MRQAMKPCAIGCCVAYILCYLFLPFIAVKLVGFGVSGLDMFSLSPLVLPPADRWNRHGGLFFAGSRQGSCIRLSGRCLYSAHRVFSCSQLADQGCYGTDKPGPFKSGDVWNQRDTDHWRWRGAVNRTWDCRCGAVFPGGKYVAASEKNGRSQCRIRG